MGSYRKGLSKPVRRIFQDARLPAEIMVYPKEDNSVPADILTFPKLAVQDRQRESSENDMERHFSNKHVVYTRGFKKKKLKRFLWFK